MRRLSWAWWQAELIALGGYGESRVVDFIKRNKGAKWAS